MYSSNLRDWGEVGNDPKFNALLGITFLVYCNIFSLLYGLEALTGFNILNQLGVGKVHAVAGAAVIGVINYFIFLHNGKYKQIAKQFKKESETKKKRRFVWCMVYVITTFACLFGSLLLLSLSLSK